MCNRVFMVQIAGLRRSVAEHEGRWFQAHGETGWTLLEGGALAVDWMVRDALRSATLVESTVGLGMGVDDVRAAVARLDVGSLVESVAKELTGQDAKQVRAALRSERTNFAARATAFRG